MRNLEMRIEIAGGRLVQTQPSILSMCVYINISSNKHSSKTGRAHSLPAVWTRFCVRRVDRADARTVRHVRIGPLPLRAKVSRAVLKALHAAARTETGAGGGDGEIGRRGDQPVALRENPPELAEKET